MKDENLIKNEVRKSYAAIANRTAESESCCDSSCCGEGDPTLTDAYKNLKGYLAEADLKLGCGIPTEYAEIKTGDTVLDLGSGAGNDCFVARSIVGEEGKVIGVDMTYEMIIKARQNNDKLGYQNVEFRLGEIEYLPIESDSIDVIVSNCVLNLIPDKLSAFKEIYRVLKPGAHFSISDIVIEGDLPEEIRNDMAAYAGCISGAVDKSEYIGKLSEAGFTDIKIKSEISKPIPNELKEVWRGASTTVSPEIKSISVFGEKK